MAQTLNMLNMDADPMLHTAYHQFEACQIESLQYGQTTANTIIIVNRMRPGFFKMFIVITPEYFYKYITIQYVKHFTNTFLSPPNNVAHPVFQYHKFLVDDLDLFQSLHTKSV